MRQQIFTMLLCTLLSSCVTKTVDRYIYVKYDIPPSVLECNTIARSEIPDPAKLTDKQVSKLLNTLFTRLLKCGVNAEQAKKIIKDTNKLVDEMNSRSPQKE